MEDHISSNEVVYGSNFFKEYCLKKEKVLEYKWIESEKIGSDIGMERAWLQWESRHYKTWKNCLDDDNQ